MSSFISWNECSSPKGKFYRATACDVVVLHEFMRGLQSFMECHAVHRMGLVSCLIFFFELKC